MFNLSKFVCVVILLQLTFDCLNTEEDVIAPPNKSIEISLTKKNNNYYGDIFVGTPKTEEDKKQKFCVNFDTGSQHLWLISKEACSATNCENVNFTPYDSDKSATYEAIHTKKPFELQYTDGTKVTGHLGWDILQLGVGDTAVQIKQTIGFATEVTGTFEDCDGIFGLGLLSESLFPGSPDPPMWTLSNEYGIGEFGIYLARVPDGEGAGKLVFGGHDETLMEGELQWHDVVNDNGVFEGYKIQVDKIIVQKGDERKEILTENMLALPDSGNNVIVVPNSIYGDIHEEIIKHMNFAHTKAYSFSCSENVNVLPDVIFVMGGHEYVLHPQDYIWVFKSGTGCKVGVFGMETDHIVLGQIFMQTFYSKFDLPNRAVGFARAKHPKRLHESPNPTS